MTQQIGARSAWSGTPEPGAEGVSDASQLLEWSASTRAAVDPMGRRPRAAQRCRVLADLGLVCKVLDHVFGQRAPLASRG
jgi:hypothetical protein